MYGLSHVHLRIRDLQCEYDKHALNRPIANMQSDAYDKILVATVGKPGESSKVFQVYRGVLCHYSDYFKAMLNSGCQEGGSDSLTLDAVDPPVFQMFYDFMNTGSLIVNEASKWEVIINAYIFAEYHLAQAFKNNVIDLYFASTAGTWSTPSVETWSRIYDDTSEGSLLRKFQVHIYTNYFKPTDLDKSKVTKDFLYDVLLAYQKHKRVPGTISPRLKFLADTKATFCATYHDHTVTKARPEVQHT